MLEISNRKFEEYEMFLKVIIEKQKERTALQQNYNELKQLSKGV